MKVSLTLLIQAIFLYTKNHTASQKLRNSKADRILYVSKAHELSVETKPSLTQSSDETLPHYIRWRSKRFELVRDWTAGKGLNFLCIFRFE